MVNVSIGPARPPAGWVGREVPRHVLVYLLLQIDAGAPVRSNDYVGANAAVEWNVTTRVIELLVGRIVNERVLSLFDRGVDGLLYFDAL